MLSSLRFLFQRLPNSPNSEVRARIFKDEFELAYGPVHPLMQARTYQSAVSQAFFGSKFLLVYLHSPLHEDTNRFCR